MKPTKRYIKVELPEHDLKRGEIDGSLKRAIFELGGYALISKIQFRLIEIKGKYAIIRFKLFDVDPSLIFLIVPLAKVRNSWLIPLACSGALSNIKLKDE
ncbi:MAG: hypothetical protein JRN26_03555 [Nitrososphaerota archaeon]|nr:hypothetical protein [Nitrososphaerota archaeon]MDG6927591.1 hypothetical protein [Nitrososphaerota archaeon]MDG6929914.1 hypothetical protein [Nitrososphaerota archaeon]MDG6931636.1 hypothetical protein [Nitrososphaerota archaeon]MDG6935947.1 hypothetical protein [Nitrososphaerota archaeon]